MNCLKSWLRLAVCGAVIVAATCVDSYAQPGGRRGGRGGFGGGAASGVMLLQSEQVQKELELVDDQKAAIKKIGDEARESMRSQFSGFRDLSQEERQAKMAELRPKMEAAQAETTKKIEEILLPNQRERLKELTIQVQGTSALANKEVADALGITEEQKTKLTAVREEAQKQMREAFSGGRGGSDEERAARREKFTNLRKEINEKTMAVLTSEQREKFEKMQGKKIELDRSQLFGGRGQGRRGNRSGNNNN